MKQFTLGALLGDNSPTPVRGDLNIVHSTETFWAPKNENIGDKVGNKKYWIGHVATDGVDWYTQTTFWQETSDGGESKRQTSAATRVTQKNIGKANETSLEQQAYSELNSIVNKQRDKKYRLEGEVLEASTAGNYPLPMLAHKYQDKKKKIQFPVWAQPKFDGVRMLTNGEIMWSRKGKVVIQDCIQHLMIDTQGHNIDGELIMPAPYSFQDTISACKRFDRKTSPLLLHRVYDIMIPDLHFSERLEKLKEIIKDSSDNIVLAETVLIHSEEELEQYHEAKVAEGWEGVIVRTDTNGYEINKRASQLLKYKSFDDEEFEVIGVETGVGKFEGLAILVFQTEHGKQFSAAPKGSFAFRKELYDKPELVIGKEWTVQFFGYTTNPDPTQVVPRFPIALAERDKDLQG
jgi:DNA ligase-1